MVVARLGARLRALALPSLDAYVAHLRAPGGRDELVHFVEAISIHHTAFFREEAHFTELAEALASWAGKGRRSFRIWSAACSSGEEPYSIAITAREALGERSSDMKVLATDISLQVLDRAARGVYAGSRLKAVPEPLRRRYFEACPGSRDDLFTVSESLRKHLVFRRVNLAQTPFPLRGPLDAVFCRNVMIYFDRSVRQGIVSEVERLLRPGGLFFVGHTENLNGLETTLLRRAPSVYQRAEAA